MNEKDQFIPTANAVPVVVQPTPVVVQPTPVIVSQPTPVGVQPTSVVVQATPYMVQPVPVTAQTAPVMIAQEQVVVQQQIPVVVQNQVMVRQIVTLNPRDLLNRPTRGVCPNCRENIVTRIENQKCTQDQCGVVCATSGALICFCWYVF